jgi:hypothetical protein
MYKGITESCSDVSLKVETVARGDRVSVFQQHSGKCAETRKPKPEHRVYNHRNFRQTDNRRALCSVLNVVQLKATN